MLRPCIAPWERRGPDSLRLNMLTTARTLTLPREQGRIPTKPVSAKRPMQAWRIVQTRSNNNYACSDAHLNRLYLKLAWGTRENRWRPGPLPPTSKVAGDGGGNGPDLGCPSELRRKKVESPGRSRLVAWFLYACNMVSSTMNENWDQLDMNFMGHKASDLSDSPHGRCPVNQPGIFCYWRNWQESCSLHWLGGNWKIGDCTNNLWVMAREVKTYSIIT